MGSGVISLRHAPPEAIVLALLAFGFLVSVLLRRPQRRRRHSRFYEWYMDSPLWRFRRWLWYVTSNRRCESCHCKVALHRRGLRYRLGAPVVTIHHKNYHRLGHEHRSDVALLCWPCHGKKDAWRHRR